MIDSKQHISKRLATLLLSLVMILPSAVKLSHALNHNHKHEVCVEKNQTHFHTADYDCEFYKFKLSNNFYLKIERFSLTENVISNKLNTTYLTYLKSHQQLSAYLRGPPNLA
jgi:hypothetical protein